MLVRCVPGSELGSTTITPKFGGGIDVYFTRLAPSPGQLDPILINPTVNVVAAFSITGYAHECR